MARSATAARLRLMGPDELRPLMRESSVSSTPKSSGAAGAQGLLREAVRLSGLGRTGVWGRVGQQRNKAGPPVSLNGSWSAVCLLRSLPMAV